MDNESVDLRYMQCLEVVRDLVQGHSDRAEAVSVLETQLAELAITVSDSHAISVLYETPKRQGVGDPVYRAYAISSALKKKAEHIKHRLARLNEKIRQEYKLLNELPDKQKQAVILKWHDGLTWGEAAQMMQISERHAMRLGALALHHMAISVCGKDSDYAKGRRQP